jgi:penicillin-binding protein 2
VRFKTIDPQELGQFRVRVYIISAVIVIVFSLLATRLWYLQILNGETYADYAKGNRIRLIPEPGLRGVIYDRNNQVLAENRPAYQLQLIREDTPDLEKTLRNVERALGIPYTALKKKVQDHRSWAKFRPIVLDEDMDYLKAMLVETYSDDFPGISVVVQSRRFYPNRRAAAHVLGYVGLSDDEVSTLESDRRMSSMTVGKAGVELIQNESMIGRDGGRQIEVDHLGREMKILGKPVPSRPGQDVWLTVDIRLQRAVDEAMEGKEGAVVVMNPRTGEILAMASYPAFDPNAFAGGIDVRSWKALLENPDHPLENKSIQGVYPPGSIFKLVTAYTGLARGEINASTRHFCDGNYFVKGRTTPFRCWKKGGHGSVDVVEAIQHSCNVFFYNVGTGVGVDRIYETSRLFGLGQLTQLGLPSEKMGLVPSSDWKERQFGERWYAGETPSLSIGQGYLSLTPLQVLNMVNVVANGGTWHRPRLLIKAPAESKDLGLNPEYLRLIREGMVAVVNAPGGTAGKVRLENFTVAGKTATSQVISRETLESLEEEEQESKDYQNHAWFAAFAPAEDPEISMIVLVEHGGGGSRAAAPVAREILEYYLNNIREARQNASTLRSDAPLEVGIMDLEDDFTLPAPEDLELYSMRLQAAFLTAE